MGGSMTRGVAIVFLLVFFGVAVALCLQNVGYVNLTLLAWSVETPVYLVAVIGYFLGTLTGWAVAGLLKRSWHRATESQTQ
jgi:uncharacterized integral membrane protein